MYKRNHLVYAYNLSIDLKTVCIYFYVVEHVWKMRKKCVCIDVVDGILFDAYS